MSEDDLQPASPHKIVDVMSLPEQQRQIVNWINRQQRATLTEVATYANLSESAAQQELQTLVEGGFIQELNDNGSCYYQSRFGSRNKSRLPSKIWDKLSDD